MNNIILASASPRRQELLTQIGMKFKVVPSNIEEKAKSKVPQEIVIELSEGKARDVFENLSEKEQEASLVIGADTIVVYEGGIMGKPKSREKAVEMLSLLQGSTHQVYTGVTFMYHISGSRRQVSFYEKTDVSMYPMSAEEIRRYVDTGEPMDKAGAYGIQGKCAAYIKEIRGDYNNVVGLPVGRLYQEMKKQDLCNWCEANAVMNDED